MYQGRCTFDEMLKGHSELRLNPITRLALCYKGMMVGTAEEKILFYDDKLCVPFEIWAAMPSH